MTRLGLKLLVIAGLLLAAWVAIGVLLTQTGSEDDDAGVATAESSPTPDLPLTLGGEPSPLLALLQYVPAADDGWFNYNDYAAVREARGIQRPAQDAPFSEVVSYWSTLSDAGMYPHLISSLFTMKADKWLLETGFNFTHIDQSLHWGSGGPCGARLAVSGSLDEAAIENAIRQTSSFRSDLTQDVHQGVPYYAWHEDCGVPAGLRPGFPDGAWPNTPGRFVVEDDHVYWSYSTAAIQQMIDARMGAAPSLADDPRLGPIADAFEETGVFSAFVEHYSDPSWFERALELAYGEYGEERVNAAGFLQPYLSLAIGVGQEGDDTYAVLLLLHEDQEAAAMNADILQEKIDTGSRFSGTPWSETITRSEIEARDTLVQAKLWSDAPEFLLPAWSSLDSLFLFRP